MFRNKPVAVSLRPPICFSKPCRLKSMSLHISVILGGILMFQRNLRYFPSYFRNVWKWGGLNSVTLGAWIKVHYLRKRSPFSLPNHDTWNSIIVQSFFLNFSHPPLVWWITKTMKSEWAYLIPSPCSIFLWLPIAYRGKHIPIFCYQELFKI